MHTFVIECKIIAWIWSLKWSHQEQGACIDFRCLLHSIHIQLFVLWANNLEVITSQIIGLFRFERLSKMFDIIELGNHSRPFFFFKCCYILFDSLFYLLFLHLNSFESNKSKERRNQTFFLCFFGNADGYAIKVENYKNERVFELKNKCTIHCTAEMMICAKLFVLSNDTLCLTTHNRLQRNIKREILWISKILLSLLLTVSVRQINRHYFAIILNVSYSFLLPSIRVDITICTFHESNVSDKGTKNTTTPAD